MQRDGSPAGSSPTLEEMKEAPAASPLVKQLLFAFAKLAGALRLYDTNNAVLEQLLTRAQAALDEALAETPELVITVHEDRLVHENAPVYEDADRAHSIPFVLYRNGFRRITLVQGMTREEVIAFLRALNTDFNSFELSGEDLATLLWRLDLPHLRYFTLDALTTADDTGGALKNEVDALIAQIYSAQTGVVPEEDLVKGVSITAADLEALRSIRLERPEDLDALDVATARVIAAVPEAELKALVESVQSIAHEALLAHTAAIGCQTILSEDTSQGIKSTALLIEQLVDALIAAKAFTRARDVVLKIRDLAQAAPEPRDRQIGQHLLLLLGQEARIRALIDALNAITDIQPAAAAEIVDFIRSLGPPAVPNMLEMLNGLTSSVHRKLVCDVIGELGVPDSQLLMDRLRAAPWFVALDLLLIVRGLQPDAARPIIQTVADRHPHPKVRAQAIWMLREHPAGPADDLIIGALRSPKSKEVLEMALRVAIDRKTPKARDVVAAWLRRDDVREKDPEQYKLLISAYADLAGSTGVPLLEKLMKTGSGVFARSVSVQLEAISALGRIATGPAIEALKGGQRSLNAQIRRACTAALEYAAAHPPPPVAPPRSGSVTRAAPAPRAASVPGIAPLPLPSIPPLPLPADSYVPAGASEDDLFTREEPVLWEPEQ